MEVLSGVVSGEFDPTLVEDEATAEATMIEKFWIGLMMVAFLSFFLSMFTKGVVESRKKKPTDKQKQTIS
ncbi:hypothetical protein KA013_04880 [Patescibacteria group bacterium]|nr:hypothetical protein [Patescibacteria group bacterium]